MLFTRISARSYSAALSNNGEVIVFGPTVFGESEAPKILNFKDFSSIVNIVVGNSYGLAID